MKNRNLLRFLAGVLAAVSILAAGSPVLAYDGAQTNTTIIAKVEDLESLKSSSPQDTAKKLLANGISAAELIDMQSSFSTTSIEETTAKFGGPLVMYYTNFPTLRAKLEQIFNTTTLASGKKMGALYKNNTRDCALACLLANEGGYMTEGYNIWKSTEGRQAIAEAGLETFKDVTANDWYKDILALAVYYGVIEGKVVEDEIQFCGEDNITMAELSAMMWRAMKTNLIPDTHSLEYIFYTSGSEPTEKDKAYWEPLLFKWYAEYAYQFYKSGASSYMEEVTDEFMNSQPTRYEVIDFIYSVCYNYRWASLNQSQFLYSLDRDATYLKLCSMFADMPTFVDFDIERLYEENGWGQWTTDEDGVYFRITENASLIKSIVLQHYREREANNQIDGYGTKMVYTAYMMGIIDGNAEGTINLYEKVTRAEALKMIFNACERAHSMNTDGPLWREVNP